ncbi:MFS transporter [Bradyrhizobium diazoefficiens]|uniref:MFS transporter n=1 Tax=Bradyrhizobium diazoefficiens TaxID=1355477 RepID=UPI0024BF9FFF|nr:MFS transporter [Bradyrhizobium diazoefficiens]
MTRQFEPRPSHADGITALLRYPAFRRIWLASLLTNLGILIQGVGAAWAMTQMTSFADQIALVQTALMLPVMLISMPAGAIADMYDRRILGLVALSIELCGATALRVGLAGPHYAESPAGVLFRRRRRYGTEALPAAVALNGVSYNIARSVGPAVGSIVVAAAGAVAAFALNALLYLPLMLALFLWKRTAVPSRLPPEKFNRAIVSGVRYIINSPSIKIVLARSMSLA